jgi:hypothetical protein
VRSLRGRIEGTGNDNGDFRSDILWATTPARWRCGEMDGAQILASTAVSTNPTAWQIVAGE